MLQNLGDYIANDETQLSSQIQEKFSNGIEYVLDVCCEASCAN